MGIRSSKRITNWLRILRWARKSNLRAAWGVGKAPLDLVTLRSWLHNGGVGRTYAELDSASSPVDYTYDPNHVHAVESVGTDASYTYDANGNMTCRVEAGVTYKQDYNVENQLITVSKMNGDCATGTILETTSFSYDGDGNLVKTTKPDGSKTIYVGGVYEVDKSSGGAVTHTRVYYPAGGAMRIDGTLYYVLKDHLGSANVVTDASGNTILGTQRYYPFGETRSTTGTMMTDRLYTGQRDTGLGIYYYSVRFYSPYINHFINADTIIPKQYNPQNLNRYSYVVNNPLKYTDPTGHMQACEDGDVCWSPNTSPIDNDTDHRRHREDDPDPTNGLIISTSSFTDNPVVNILRNIINDYLNGMDLLGQKGCLGSPGSTYVFLNTPECLDVLANASQDLATFFSTMGASATTLTTITGCVVGVIAAELGCAGGYAIGRALHVGFYNIYESGFSTISFMATAYSDSLSHETYFNGLHDWDIGEDTRTGFFTFLAGTLSTDPFIDAGVDIYSSGYNHGYFCGVTTILDC